MATAAATARLVVLLQLFVLLSASASSSSTTFDIARDCGAVPDNATVATAAIQQCIDLGAPGDTVLVPRGIFLTGSVSLRSGLTLRFADGGWLQGSANASLYNKDWDYWHVVQAVAASDVLLVADSRGGGGIVGPMWQMIGGYDPRSQIYTPMPWNADGCSGECRPKNLALIDCVRCSLVDIALRDSSDWTLLLRRCSDTLLDGLVIRGSQSWGNNDGMDIESGTNYTLRNLDIATGDDCIALRSGNCNAMRTPWARPLPPLDGVRISNCSLSSSSSGIKVEALFQADHGDVRNLLIEDLTIYRSNRGVGIWQRVAGPSGGVIRDIVVRNAVIETRYVVGTPWWGSGEAIVVTSVPENPQQMASGLPGIFNVSFYNIVATSEGGSLFSSRGQRTTSPRALAGIELRNVSLTIVAPHDPASVHNQLDFRPVDDGGGAPNTVPALVAGITFEDVAGVTIAEGCSVTFAALPQPYWAGPGNVGLCITADSDTNSTVDAGFQCLLAS